MSPVSDDIPVGLNYSGGTSSKWMLYAIMRGLIPRPKHVAVFQADTGDEHEWTYEDIAKVRDDCKREGIDYFECRDPRETLVENVLAAIEGRATRADTPPFFTENQGGGRGRLRQECTGRFKTSAIRRSQSLWLESIRLPKKISTWIGFGHDEQGRATKTVGKCDVQWARPDFPAIRLGVTRAAQRADFERWGVVAPRFSMCKKCPFKSPQRDADFQSRPTRSEETCFISDRLIPLERLIRKGDPQTHASRPRDLLRRRSVFRIGVPDDMTKQATIGALDALAAIDRPVDIELFSCSGGMALGFQAAGVEFDFAFEWDKNHAASYKHNVGHAPICMDVHDLLRLLREGGMRFKNGVRLLVCDPPCTPWSRAGKQEGTSDERDMLVPTCEIIKLLRPQAYLIGNVPGLDDGPNLGTVQKIIGSLHTHGYCTADFARLDAANYGVPQHRIRPFWFGHLAGPCVQWPAPTHGDPKDLLNQPTLPGVDALLPWITCGQALRHLPPEEIGRPVKLRWRSQNSDQHGSVPDKPARVVGTSNLSDGNVLVEGVTPHKRGKKPKAEIMGNDKHRPLEHDKPASTIGAKSRGNGSSVMEIEATTNHPPSFVDEPAMTVRATDGGGSRASLQVSGKRGRKRDEGRGRSR
jgi:site-specific DNA-cytosine methylase